MSPARFCSALRLETPAVGEQFAVLLFFYDGKRRYARRFVSAQEAIRAFEFYIRNANARDARIARVVVTDVHDCILREWKIGRGVISIE
jgi:hypothetical protein